MDNKGWILFFGQIIFFKLWEVRWEKQGSPFFNLRLEEQIHMASGKKRGSKRLCANLPQASSEQSLQNNPAC